MGTGRKCSYRTMAARLEEQAYADSLLAIPRTLAENAGLDPIDVLASLNSAHTKDFQSGIDVFSGKIINAWNKGIIEPLKIKTQALSSATDVATMILRIDDVITSERANQDQSPMPPGME